MKPIRNNLTKLLVMGGVVCAVLGTAGTLAHAGTLGHGFRLAALPKVERSGASVIHLSWETKL